MREPLYRSRSDRMLFGVAGGMARYFDIDASVVRIIWALLVIAGGAGLLLYVVAAIVIPEEPSGWSAANGRGTTNVAGAADSAAHDAAVGPGAASGPPWGYRAGLERRNRGGAGVVLGLVLIVLGAWFLLRRFIPAIDSDVLWPVLLLVLGGILVLGALRRRP